MVLINVIKPNVVIGSNCWFYVDGGSRCTSINQSISDWAGVTQINFITIFVFSRWNLCIYDTDVCEETKNSCRRDCGVEEESEIVRQSHFSLTPLPSSNMFTSNVQCISVYYPLKIQTRITNMWCHGAVWTASDDCFHVNRNGWN